MSKTMSALAITLALASPALAQTAAPDAPAPAADADAAPAPAAPAAATPAAADAAAPGDAAAAAHGDLSGTYTFDPSHSQVVFNYDHLGFSTSHGFVNGVSGAVTLDQASPAGSSVEAQFPLSAIVTIAPALDEHLMKPEFFNGAAPATAVAFKSTSVEPKGTTEAVVVGDLTLNGVTKPVTMEVEITQAGPHPMSGKPTVGFEIEGKLLRSDFNLGALAPAVGDEVEFEISVEASKG